MSYYTLASSYPSACRIPHLENNFYIYGEMPPIIKYPEAPSSLESQRLKRINQFSKTQDPMRYHNPQSSHPLDNFAQTADYSFNPNNREYYLNQEIQKIKQRQSCENLENSRGNEGGLRLKDLEYEEKPPRFRQGYQYKQESVEIPRCQPYDQNNNLSTFRDPRPASSCKNSNISKSEEIPRNGFQIAKSSSFYNQENPQEYKISSEDLVDYSGNFGRTSDSEGLKSSNCYKKGTSELSNFESKSFIATKNSEKNHSSNSKFNEKNTSEIYQSESLEDERGRNEKFRISSNSSFKSKNEDDFGFTIDNKNNFGGTNSKLSPNTSTVSKSYDNFQTINPSKEHKNTPNIRITSEASSDQDATFKPMYSSEYPFQSSNEYYNQTSKDFLRIPGKDSCNEIKAQNDFKVTEKKKVTKVQKCSKSSKKLSRAGLPPAKGVKGKPSTQANGQKKFQQKNINPSNTDGRSNQLDENISEYKRDDNLSNTSSRLKVPYEPHYLKSTFSCEVKSMPNKQYSYYI